MKSHLKAKFLAGIFAAVPLAVTGFIIYYVESQTRRLFHVPFPFLGVLIALVGIYVLGIIVTSLLGRYFLGAIDRLLLRIPVLKDLYHAWKQVSLSPGGGEGIFAKVVLISDESGMHQMLGFSTGLPIENDPATTCVFVPAAPNPTNGRLYFVPLSRCRVLDVSTEDAFKMILSGGNFVPANVGLALAAPVMK
jgi:uncharacterized membrane protein